MDLTLQAKYLAIWRGTESITEFIVIGSYLGEHHKLVKIEWGNDSRSKATFWLKKEAVSETFDTEGVVKVMVIAKL